MKIFYLYDASGFYIGDSPSFDGEKPTTPNYTDIKPPNGLFKGKYDSSSRQWVEGMSQQEIDEIRNKPIPISKMDEMEQQISDINLVLADIIGG